MSISYQPKQSQVQAVQLKVQQLVLKSSDNDVVQVSGLTAIVSFGQAIEDIRACMHVKDGDPSPLTVSKADIALNPAKTVATLTLSAALAADDAIIIDFVAAKA